ncbi:hypothetical protein MMC07_004933 [Pseudocyphellaria aurata]|nr:hypothetical protein [Pseudocyphellaria aurata]
MPVTTYPALHGANAVSFQTATTPLGLLKSCSQQQSSKVKQMIQSSFPPQDFPHNVVGDANGFVNAMIHAYNRHQHLSIRPEDVWISILAQFSHYVNANAEKLRSTFVAHEGQKELVIHDGGTIHTYDFGIFAKRMTGELEKSVLDKDLRRWIMPSFSTTTYTDQVVAAVVMMGTLQKYFTYKCVLECGLPSVTLLGERSDWEDILMRLEKLPSFGDEPTQWYKLLKPVIARFLKTFDEPESEGTINFWQKIANAQAEGSGSLYYSGWITAFCFWDADGKVLAPSQSQLAELDREQKKRAAPQSDGPASSWLDLQPEQSADDIWEEKPLPICDLDGVLYHRIDSDDVPPGFVSVPVTVDDNGMVYKTAMVAGSVAYRVESAAADVRGRVPGQRDALRPQVGWFMYEKNDEKIKTNMWE